MYLLKPFLAGAFAGAGLFKLALTLLFGFSGDLPAYLSSDSGHETITGALLVVTLGAGVWLAASVRMHRLARTKKA